MMDEACQTIRETYETLCAKWACLSRGEKSALLENFSVGFSFNSGKIENDEITYHDTREIFDKDGVSSYTGSLRTLYEIKNQKEAWKWALEVLDEGFEVSPATIRHAHALLTQGTYDSERWAKGERPGEFKHGDYVVGVLDVGYLPDEVPQAVDELCEETAEFMVRPEASRNALTISAYLHARIAEIHPFADGNGRCARLLGNMILMSLSKPPLIIHEQNRAAYFGALNAFSEEGDLEPMRMFCMTESIATWSKTLLAS